MENKSNIYKSTPEFVKEGFDPFSIQYIDQQPIGGSNDVTNDIYMRACSSDGWYYAVDYFGARVPLVWDNYDVVLVKKQDQQFYLVPIGPYYEDVLPFEVRTWGVSSIDTDAPRITTGLHFFSYNDSEVYTDYSAPTFTVECKGKTYNCVDGVMSPHMEDYQETPLPPPPPNMYWRTPQNANDKFAVDAEGRLILANWEGSTTDYVLWQQEGVYRSTNKNYIQIPELNTWGNSPTKAALSGDDDVIISYDGQTFVMADDGSTFTPELQDYQP